MHPILCTAESAAEAKRPLILCRHRKRLYLESKRIYNLIERKRTLYPDPGLLYYRYRRGKSLRYTIYILSIKNLFWGRGSILLDRRAFRGRDR